MDIETVIKEAREGRFRPVHVLTGGERFLLERAISLLKKASLGDGPAGFNDDVFHGTKQLATGSILSAARTLPMMAAARFILVRNVENLAADQLDPLVDYLGNPSDTTCLVLVADKLDGRSKLTKAAKKHKIFTNAQPLKGGAVQSFVRGEAEARGHTMDGRAAQALADALGTDLSAIDDALERLSLYVGEGKPISVEAVEACVTRIRTDSIWALVDAVSLRDRRRALAAAASLVGDHEPPLRILAMLARQLRMVARMREALASGAAGADAAKQAGAPPFKARELTDAARRFSFADLSAAFDTLAEADLALKGSQRQPPLVLEEAILRLCTPGARATKWPPSVKELFARRGAS